MLRQSPNNSKSNNKNINPSPSKNKFVKNTQNALRSSFRNFPFRRTQTTVDTFAVEQYQSKNYQKSTTTTTTASSVPSSTSLENLNSIQPLYAPPAIRMTPPFKSPIQYPGIQLTNTPKLTNSNHYLSSSNSSSNLEPSLRGSKGRLRFQVGGDFSSKDPPPLEDQKLVKNLTKLEKSEYFQDILRKISF